MYESNLINNGLQLEATRSVSAVLCVNGCSESRVAPVGLRKLDI